jgi:succinoglycan biosynthesis protein ExoV
MPLYYCEHERLTGHSNLGDDLNPYLLPKVLGDDIISKCDSVVIGIGTILNNWTEEENRHYIRKYVFSSGFGYGNFIPEFDSSWKFIAVRGHLTRQRLKLPDDTPVGDGAILIDRHLPQLSQAGKGEIVFMPHVDYHRFDQNAWRRAASYAGFTYLAPSAPRDHILSVLRNAKLLITSAMHGAIISDTLRTPWVAVSSFGVNTTKWHDWSSALDLAVHFEEVPHISAPDWRSKISRVQRQINIYRTSLILRRLKSRQGQLSNEKALRSAQLNLETAASKFRESSH